MGDLDSQTIQSERVDYIKLTKNTRGYSWDIKINFNTVNNESDQALKTLKDINAKLINEYTTEGEF